VLADRLFIRHGLKQRLNCWADGVPSVTQCPIRPGRSFTYHLNVSGQEGTLWWHAHVSCLRASLHGALVIRPRHAYPFPKPDKEIPIVIGSLVLFLSFFFFTKLVLVCKFGIRPRAQV